MIVKIKRSDVEEFIKLIEKNYGTENISKTENINFILYKWEYLLQFKNIYYQVKSFKHEWYKLNKEFVERPVEYGFTLPFYILEEITHLYKNKGDDYITFKIKLDKTGSKKTAVLETILNRFQIDLNNNEFNELKKCLMVELKASELMKNIQKYNKITFGLKTFNNVNFGKLNINLQNKELVENFIKYNKSKEVKLYFNNDAYLKIDKALLYIKQ